MRVKRRLRGVLSSGSSNLDEEFAKRTTELMKVIVNADDRLTDILKQKKFEEDILTKEIEENSEHAGFDKNEVSLFLLR